MSVEDLKNFGKAVAENPEYQKKCIEIGIDDTNGLMAFAKELGYEFSRDDALALSEEAGAISEELSEDDLEKVAGGGNFNDLIASVLSALNNVLSVLNNATASTMAAVHVGHPFYAEPR